MTHSYSLLHKKEQPFVVTQSREKKPFIQNILVLAFRGGATRDIELRTYGGSIFLQNSIQFSFF